jgi:hypothetical protein
MDWRVKMLGEKICSILPLGYKLASAARNKMVGMQLDYEERIDKCLDNVAMMRALTGFDLENKTVLEVGTGRHGVDCIVYYTLGAKSICTFDHVLHLEKDVMASAVEPLRSKLDDMSEKLDLDKDRMAGRLNDIKTDGTLADLLTSCKVNYFKYPIHSAGLEPGSVDLFFSESVLQRIPTNKLKQVIATAGGLLSKTGISFHRIDCKDINSQERHYGAGLWTLHYLKYSDFVWNLMCSKKFNSQNRLREIEFIQLLEAAGLNTMYVESLRRAEDVERLREFPLAKRFRGMPVEEVAVVCSKVVSVKSKIPGKERKIIEENWTKWYGVNGPVG